MLTYLIYYYIYQQDKGGFRGSLVALALGAHIKRTIGYELISNDNLKLYGFPIGGLAVSAAVVCRLVYDYLDHTLPLL